MSRAFVRRRRAGIEITGRRFSLTVALIWLGLIMIVGGSWASFVIFIQSVLL
ncbi:hypothetical protein MMA231_00946 [Asticcacaulis sp. MM231]|uniref:hypothetical protein n=1 Tax=Asticcacaulis sp. MM231 TaxID=3157666 RepID=UPI0032D58230